MTIDTTTASWGFITNERAAEAEHGEFTYRERTHVDRYANRLCEDASRDFTEHLQALDDDAYSNARAEFGGHRAKVHIAADLELLADWDKAWRTLHAGLYAFEGTDATELSPAAAAFLTAEKHRLDAVRERVHEVAFAYLLRKVRTSE